MKFAVVVLAFIGMACANPISPWGVGLSSVQLGASGVSYSGNLVNHGITVPVVSKVITPVIARPVIPVVQQVVPVVRPIVSAPIISSVGWNGIGWNGIGLNGIGWNGLGGKGLGLGWGKGWH